MKKSEQKELLLEPSFIKALATFITLSLTIVGIVLYFATSSMFIGPIFILLGLLSLVVLYFFKISPIAVYPDLIFGAIDNGFLIIAAVIGGNYGGVFGAIIGGAIGNTITDGIGGLFEGHIAAHQRKFKIDNLRTAMSTSIGKMAGCLLGAGVGLIIMSFFGRI
ncbi:MAG: hypothetical protein ACOC3Z_00720 [Nanoarchaeota archaeon]